MIYLFLAITVSVQQLLAFLTVHRVEIDNNTTITLVVTGNCKLYKHNQEHNNINKKGNIDHKVGDQRKDPFFRDVEQDSAARGGARTLHLTGYTPRSCQQPDPSRDETGCQDLPLVPTGSDSVKTTYQWVWGYQYLVFEQKPRIERECAYSPACTYGD